MQPHNRPTKLDWQFLSQNFENMMRAGERTLFNTAEKIIQWNNEIL